MSSNFSLQEQDEWLDVTTKEELLQREVEALNSALEEKEFELTETNITIDVLKGHKLLLENERYALKNEMQGKDDILSSVQEELKSTLARTNLLENELETERKTSNQQLNEWEELLLEKSSQLREALEQLTSIETRFANREHEHQKEAMETLHKMQNQEDLVSRLQAQIAAMEAKADQDQHTMADYELQLQESKKREDTLTIQLSQEKSIADQRLHDLQSLKGDTGAIAIVAENLRAEKQDLERALTRTKNDFATAQKELNETQISESHFKQELALWKSTSEERITELEDSLNSNKCDLDDARTLIGSLSDSLAELNLQMTQVKQSLNVECEKTRRLADVQRRLLIEMDDKAQEYEFLEERLREELLHAKQATERRLNQLRDILGVSSSSGYAPPKPSYWGTYEPPVLASIISFV